MAAYTSCTAHRRGVGLGGRHNPLNCQPRTQNIHHAWKARACTTLQRRALANCKVFAYVEADRLGVAGDNQHGVLAGPLSDLGQRVQPVRWVFRPHCLGVKNPRLFSSCRVAKGHHHHHQDGMELWCMGWMQCEEAAILYGAANARGVPLGGLKAFSLCMLQSNHHQKLLACSKCNALVGWNDADLVTW